MTNRSSLRPGRWIPGLLALLFAGVTCAAEPLQSWNDGPSKARVLAFVQAVTDKGSREFVLAAQRIATFDNDGTLWAEQPMYFQFLFAIDSVKMLAPKHPEWKDQAPFASLLKGDLKGAMAGGEKALLQIMAVTHSGVTTEEYEKVVKDW